MHPGFSIPGNIQPQPEPHNILPASMIQTPILDQIHNIPLTQPLLLQGRPHLHSSNSDYFKLGLNDNICATNDHDEDEVTTHVGVNRDEGTAFLRGSQQYEDPDGRYCWQNQEDSAVKHPVPFWEPLTAEEAYENSETVGILESLIASLNQKENPTTCLESKSRQLFGPTEIILPVDAHLPMGLELDDGSEASISAFLSKKKSRKKRHYGPIAQFFEKLVKQVMDHQENLQRKFTEVIERLDEERRERDEAWRNRKLAHFQEEAAARAREKAMAASREATIISYLEKISGQRIHLIPIEQLDDFI